LAGKGEIVLLFAVLGFVAGIFASMSFPLAIPFLAAIPRFLSTPWFLSGVVGALFAVVVLLVYIAAQR
jgi:hypothetical protein